MEHPIIDIREAVLEDLPILEKFEQEIIKFERSFASNLKDDPITYYDLKDLIERKDAQVLVALLEEEIVGSGYALIKNSVPYFEPEQYAYLGFMYGTNESALKAYQKMGFKPDLQKMRLNTAE